MKTLGQITERLKQNGRGQQLSEATSQQRAETAKCVAVAVTQAFDVQKNYGADPDSLESRVNVFTRILGGYSAKEVQSAFDSYFENNSGIPEPSDIAKIIKERQVYNRPEYKVFDPAKEENHPGYMDLSGKEQAEIDALLAETKKILNPPKEMGERENRPIGKHFYSMPSEVQKQVMESCMESVKRGGF